MNYFPPHSQFCLLGNVRTHSWRLGHFHVLQGLSEEICRTDPFNHHFYWCAISETDKGFIAKIWKHNPLLCEKESKPFKTEEEAAHWLDREFCRVSKKVLKELHDKFAKQTKELAARLKELT